MSTKQAKYPQQNRQHDGLDLTQMLALLADSLDSINQANNLRGFSQDNALWEDWPSSNAAAQNDLTKARMLLDEACSFTLASRKQQSLGNVHTEGTELLENSVYRTRTSSARISVKISRRWVATNGSHRGLLDFRAVLTRVPTHGKGGAITAEFRQHATRAGLLALPPSVGFSSVIDPDDELFRLIDHDDALGLRQHLRAGKASIRDCDVFGWGVLHRASWNCSAELWSILIDEGADIDCVTAAGSSFLLLGCGVDYHRKLQLSLEAGADPTCLPNGQFHLANMGVDAVRSIMRVSGPFIDLRLRESAQGRTLLLATAAATHNPDQAMILRLLVRTGAGIDACDDNGSTCLHLVLGSMRSGQRQSLEALIVLLAAGANPLTCNYAGQSAIDLACEADGAGRHRRSALRQALFDTRCPVIDRRLTEPKHSPTKGDDMMYKEADPIRARLLRKVVLEVDCSGAFTRYQVHEAAVDRVITQMHTANGYHFDHLFFATVQYLRLMIKGKNKIVIMTKDRLAYRSWIPYGRLVNVIKITEESELAALLEFDWWRPVDYEDLFVSYVENLIQRFEDFKEQQGHHEQINQLIAKIENALPSHAEMTQRSAGTVSTIHSDDPPSEQPVELPMRSGAVLPAGRGGSTQYDFAVGTNDLKRFSIVKTPTEFYSAPPWNAKQSRTVPTSSSGRPQPA
ncbi:hypothetical protein LTR86_004180 [Recurvomyces mirabilis]|nr:hypothetical protein LTR86_004180 [Recurvomyces mirabilis]